MPKVAKKQDEMGVQSLKSYFVQTRKGPVYIKQNGRSEFVALTAKDYDLLVAMCNRTNRTFDMSTTLLKIVENSEMSSKHRHLDKLMNDT